MESAKRLDLPFSTADAEHPSLRLDKTAERLEVAFTDWKEQKVRVAFDNIVAVRWQEIFQPGPELRDDESYEILNSEWVAEHLRQGAREPVEDLHHFRLCFNACGVLDVIATTIRLIPSPPKPDIGSGREDSWSLFEAVQSSVSEIAKVLRPHDPALLSEWHSRITNKGVKDAFLWLEALHRDGRAPSECGPLLGDLFFMLH